MKMRHKGKIHPSSSSSSSFPASPIKDAQSVLKLLPATILAIALVLPLEDREVLAYMITRSLNIPTNPSAFHTKKSSNGAHKPPLFDCECFDCYISYWFRWDSSPNRELIHQAIEEFEEALNNEEKTRKRENKKRDKKGRRGLEKMLLFSEAEAANQSLPEIQEWGLTEQGSPENAVPLLETADLVSESGESSELSESLSLDEEAEAELLETAAVMRGAEANNYKGLARKVLPDVLGLFNSRLWNLWNPSV